jgi:hypothetical protein
MCAREWRRTDAGRGKDGLRMGLGSEELLATVATIRGEEPGCPLHSVR